MNGIVSLIIPTYNRRHTLERVIDSYLCQKHIKEIIFVIDGSNDGTFEFVNGLRSKIESCPIVKIKKLPEKTGVSNARNIGISLATGKFIMIGEDDVTLQNDYIPTLLKCITETGADIIAGRILYLESGERIEEAIKRCDNSKRELINYWFMSVLHSAPFKKHTAVPFFHALGFGKTEIFKKIMYSSEFHAREETDFYIRAGKEGARLMLCPHTMCFHLPKDKERGGGWNIGVIKFQLVAIRNNNMLIDRHYKYMKKWGMKGNKLTFKMLHFINRFRIMYSYFKDSVKYKKSDLNSMRHY